MVRFDRLVSLPPLQFAFGERSRKDTTTDASLNEHDNHGQTRGEGRKEEETFVLLIRRPGFDAGRCMYMLCCMSRLPMGGSGRPHTPVTRCTLHDGGFSTEERCGGRVKD